ncbi:hypothetical protein SEUCBS139899_007462 [Sporothrix eucalyptigena]|uniref:Uncharacterized protein n=1 Tax=Sporothrix eucalyptigena TaxID=1812306 RepID=A0ABP0B9L6_9PEZI
MAPRRLLALAAFVLPLVSASPVRPRDDTDVWPTPTWFFPGPPSSTVTASPVNPGGPIVPDPWVPGGHLHPDPTNPGGSLNPDPTSPGGSLSPDPVSPGAPIEADPTTPGGDLNPDDPSYGDDSTTLHVGRTVENTQNTEDDGPDPFFGFGTPAQPVINPGPIIPGGPIEGSDDVSSGQIYSPRNQESTAGRANVNPVLFPSPRPAQCTFTVRAMPGAPNGCAFDGTLTVYTATATVTRTVDCQGCVAAVFQSRMYACPMQTVGPVTTAAAPKTQYAAVCSATPTAEVTAI